MRAVKYFVLGVLVTLFFCGLSHVSVSFAGAGNVFEYGLSVGVKPQYLVYLGDGLVAMVGGWNGSDVVAVYNVSDPVGGPIEEMVYPLTGKVTAIATNGYPTHLLAIGTDAGELLILKTTNGKIYKLIDYLGGTSFAIRKLLVLTAGNGYRVVALTGHSSTSPCLDCQVFVVDPESRSFLRVGNLIGNVTAGINGIYPQQVLAPLIVTPNGYYWDATDLIVLWFPRKEYVHLLLNVTYVEKNEVHIGRGALIKVVAYNRVTGVTYVYGVNANGEGVADVVVPRGYDVNVTLWDVFGRRYLASFTLSKLPEYVETVEEHIELRASPITTDAEKIYGTPKFMQFRATVIDVSGAPQSYRVIRTLAVRFPMSMSNAYVTQFGGRYVLGYVADGMLRLMMFGGGWEWLNVSWVDFVGNDPLVGLVGYSGYLHVALRDCVRSYYFFAGRFILGYDYVVPSDSPIEKIRVIYGTPYPTYAVVTKAGTEIVALKHGSAFPLLRNATTLFYGTGIADFDPRLTYFLTARSNQVTVIRNLGTLIEKETQPINPTKYRLPQLTIHLLTPPHENPEAIAVIRSNKVNITKTFGNSTTLRIPYLYPGNYTVEVVVRNPRLRGANVSVCLVRSSVVTLRLGYRFYRVRLYLVDGLTNGSAVGGFRVYVDGSLIGEFGSNVSLRLVYGLHDIRIEPLTPLYQSRMVEVRVTNNTVLSVPLIRRTYVLSVVVVDGVTGRSPVVPLVLSVNGSSEVLKKGGAVKLELPAGYYVVRVTALKGFRDVYFDSEVPVNLTSDKTVSVLLKRREYNLTIKLRDVTVGQLLGRFKVVMNNTVVARNVSREVNITLPYGRYVVVVEPEGKYVKIYGRSRPSVVVLNRDEVLSVGLRRVFYGLSFAVYNDIGKSVGDARINIVPQGKGLATTLITDTSGTASTTLPYGVYRVEVSAKGYYGKTMYIVLDSQKNVNIYLTPKPLTVVMRFLPTIVLVVIAGLVAGLVIKIKSKLAERLLRSESVF